MICLLNASPTTAQSPVAAQRPALGALIGIVKDAAGQPVRDAIVTAVRADGDGVHGTLSGSDGMFSFADLPAGSWRLTVQLDGRPDTQSAALIVQASRTTRFDLALKAPIAPAAPAPAAVATPANRESTWLRSFTLNAMLDGYYEYNFNAPVGRVNNLRAYDVSSNSFSLNQADIMLESLPDVDAGKRFGVRIDLQYGQATAAQQGNAANELRPEVYRNVFQAYGTYVLPLAAGWTVDFGKWDSALGAEGNYTKDQLNYSRSYWYDFLPFYHEGFRSKLALNQQIALEFWLTNGVNQTEDENSAKDYLVGLVLAPTHALSWTLNYYRGQEHPDVVYVQAEPIGQTLPVQQGSYVEPIAAAPNGKLVIVDSYAAWQLNDALLLGAEADYVEERLYGYSSPRRANGAALYAGYKISSLFSAAGRAEYLADEGGLFSGVTQYLKEGTLTFDYHPVEGFLLRSEFRRDFSNVHYFYGHALADPRMVQPTITLGLVWWLGGKTGAW